MSKLLTHIRNDNWTAAMRVIKKLSGSQLHQLESMDSPMITILQYAVKSGKFNAVQSLLAKPGYTTVPKVREMMNEAIKLQFNKIAKLIFAKLPARVRHLPDNSKFEATPLHYAIGAGNYEMFKFLLKNGADPNAKAYNRERPLHQATMFGEIGMIAELLKTKRIRINTHRSPDGLTALQIAAKTRQEMIFDLLLAAGANVNSITYYGDNLLVFPITLANPDFRKKLFANGINVNQVGRYNETAVTMVLGRAPPINKFRGPDGVTRQNFINWLRDVIPRMDPLTLNLQTFEGDTALHLLIKKGWWSEITDAAKKCVWNLWAKDIDGITPYDVAYQLMNKQDFKKFIDTVAESYLHNIKKSLGVSTWETNCKKINNGNSKKELITELKRAKIKVPTGLTKHEMCILLAKYQIEKKQKSYPGKREFDLFRKINILAKQDFAFRPIVWMGEFVHETLLMRHIIAKHSRHMNNHFPPLSKLAKPSKHSKGGDRKHDIQTRVMFSWNRMYSKKPKLYPPKFASIKGNKQFTAIPLDIYYSSRMVHFGLILIDHKNKTFERFEPHGYKAAGYYNIRDLDKALWGYCKKKLPGYKFLISKEVYPRNGIQLYENDNLYRDQSYRLTHGYCAIWGLWYIDMILSNWEIMGKFKTRKQFLEAIMLKIITNFSSFQKYILTYARGTSVTNRVTEIAHKVGITPDDISGQRYYDNPKLTSEVIKATMAIKV